MSRCKSLNIARRRLYGQPRTTSPVCVSTGEYEFSHGKKPRGYGHWAFFIGSETVEPVFFTGLYGECKKQAVALAKSKGVNVFVGS